MAIIKRSIALAAAALLAVQPCAAADLAPLEGSRQSGLYGGIYARLPLGKGGRIREEARAGLSLGPTHLDRTANGRDGVRRTQINLVDVGIVGSGRPSMLIAGRELVDERGRLSLQGDGRRGGGVSALAIVIGVVVIAGVGYLLIREQFDCDPNGECY